MANNLNTNPVIIDTTGDIFAGTPVKVKAITVHASADSWVVSLRDTKGNVVYSRASTATGDRGWTESLEGIVWQGLNAQTLTNITRVLVHLA